MNDYTNLLNKQKQYLKSMKYIDVNERIKALKTLKATIKTHESLIIDALYKDLGKSEFEAFTTEVGFIYNSIDYTLKNIRKWSKVKKVKNDIAQLPGSSYIYNSPYGSVLIIGPYNYPFQLTIEPLIGAIAGGNTAIIKPSEFTPNVEAVLVDIIKEAFDSNYVDIITGDYKVNSSLLDLPFDYIFFTGSVNVGKIVMEKASKHLTPITLELGGKSPVIVDDTIDLSLSAKRIAWGKFSNAGQTCVAPDYILVKESVYDKFVDKMKIAIEEFYTENIAQNKDYGRIVNDRHTNRLSHILEVDKDKIIYGGNVDLESRYIEPTLLGDVNYNDEVMKDEIFGPILPIIKCKSINDIEMYLEKYEKPLALYVFSENKAFSEDIITRFSFGGGCINDTMTHVASKYLPFGGVGKSGIGRYHGFSSFKTFTYEKAIVKKSTKVNISLVFPPYKDKISLVRKFMK